MEWAWVQKKKKGMPYLNNKIFYYKLMNLSMSGQFKQVLNFRHWNKT